MSPNINKIKSSLYPLAAVLAPLGVMGLLFWSGIADINYPNEPLHAGLMAIVVLIDFYIVYIAYSIYSREKHVFLFFVALAFIAAGIGHAVHALTAAEHGKYLEAVFDFSEHFGLFLSATILCVGFIDSFKQKTEDFLYAERNKIIAAFAGLNLLGYFFLIFFYRIPDTLSATINIFIAFTGMALLFLMINLWAKYKQTGNHLSLFAALGTAMLINAAIVPFFYEEWNLCWWYWHLVLVAGNSLILYGVVMARSGAEEIMEALTDIPFYSRILTRMFLFFVLVLAIGPLILSGYLSLVAFGQNLQQQMLSSLSIVAESKEGHLYSFLSKIRARVADFSSDGMIRDLTARIVRDPTDAEAVRTLNYHLRVNKMPLSQVIYGINIIGFNGQVIASTNAVELGKDEHDDDYFQRTLALKYGESVVNDAHFSHHFAVDKNTITVSAPIYDRATGKSVGIIVNYYETSELDDILSGREQVRLGAISGTFGFYPTLDLYLVNKDGLMISESRFLGKDVFLKQRVDSEAAQACRDNNKETAGVWKNYLGNDVLGVTMCNPDLHWTLVAEIDQKDAVEPVGDFRRSLTNSTLLTMLLTAVFGVYFSRRLSKPIESLINTTKDITLGNYGARVPIESRDEIGELGKSFNVMLDKLGEFTRTLGIERKKLETILDSLPMAVSIVDEERTIQYANWVFKKTFGSKCIGDKCYALAKDNKQVCPNCPLRDGVEALKINSPGVVDVDGVAGGRIYSIIHAPFEDVGGKQFVIEVFRDVTKEREIDRAKSEFVSVASHQLRTPLTAINWYVEMLLSGELGKLTPKQSSYLQEVYDGSKRMGSLVNDLLNLSRIESGKIKSEPTLVRVDIMIERIIADFKPVALEKKCDLVFKKDNLEFPEINLDQTLFRQVIVNMLANAVAYSKEGACSVNIELHLDTKNAEITVSIKDSGIGIPKDDQPLIFGKFFRAGNAAKSVTTGTGLGLYISKLIIESFGGRIWFESKEDVGTTFFVALPLGGMKRSGNGEGGGNYMNGQQN